MIAIRCTFKTQDSAHAGRPTQDKTNISACTRERTSYRFRYVYQISKERSSPLSTTRFRFLPRAEKISAEMDQGQRRKRRLSPRCSDTVPYGQLLRAVDKRERGDRGCGGERRNDEKTPTRDRVAVPIHQHQPRTSCNSTP